MNKCEMINASSISETRQPCHVLGEYVEFRFIYGFCDLTCFQENLKTETLLKQFQIVKEETNTSHVQEFGDLASISQTRQPFCFEKNITTGSGSLKQI